MFILFSWCERKAIEMILLFPKLINNQMEQGKENLKEEAIFPNLTPLRYLSSSKLYKDWHYRDGGLLFLLTKEGYFWP